MKFIGIYRIKLINLKKHFQNIKYFLIKNDIRGNRKI